MKRISPLLLSLVLLLCAVWFAPAAQADVIWEPQNDFYAQHAQECEYLDGHYTAPGQVEGYGAPTDSNPSYTFQEGSSFYLSFGYTDASGQTWGIYEGDVTCWLRLDDLEKVYDNNDFLKDHESELAPYAGELDDYAVQSAMLLWSYPGSGVIVDKLPAEIFDEIDFCPYQSVYTDLDGARWAYISYLYGSSGWVWIDDPENSAPEKEQPEPQTPVATPVAAAFSPALLWAVGAVVVVALVSAVLIVVFYRKKKKS